MQDLARAKVQKAALDHYVLPVIAGRCPDLTASKVAVRPGDCATDAVDCPPVKPLVPPPAGGHWAMTGKSGTVTLRGYDSGLPRCEGEIDDGSGLMTVASVRCSDPGGPTTFTYDWTPLPEHMVPEQRYEITVSVTGRFDDDAPTEGQAGLEMLLAVSHPDYCGSPDQEEVSFLTDTDGKGLFVSDTRRESEQTARGSGVVVAPVSGFGAGHFEVRVCANTLGRYTYVYDWQDGEVPAAEARRRKDVPASVPSRAVMPAPAPAPAPGLSVDSINNLLTGN